MGEKASPVKPVMAILPPGFTVWRCCSGPLHIFQEEQAEAAGGDVEGLIWPIQIFQAEVFQVHLVELGVVQVFGGGLVYGLLQHAG